MDILRNCSIEGHKVTAMEESKRLRLFEVAIEEFAKGYSVANTDTITSQTGISKGLLFHYFGTKKGLFLFLFEHVVEAIQQEYLKVTFQSRDFLENLRKVSLLAMELSMQYSVLYQFIGKAVAALPELFPEGMPQTYLNGFEEMMLKISQNTDTSLFREGIDVEKARDIIIWTTKGFSERLQTAYGNEFDDYKADYGRIERELDEYLQLLRTVLYRPNEG